MQYTDRLQIDEVLVLLEDAIEKKEEQIRRSVFSRPSFSKSSFLLNAEKKIKQSYKVIGFGMVEWQRSIKRAIDAIEQEAKENPQALLKKMALSSFGLGVMMGRHYKNLRMREKK